MKGFLKDEYISVYFDEHENANPELAFSVKKVKQISFRIFEGKDQKGTSNFLRDKKKETSILE